MKRTLSLLAFLALLGCGTSAENPLLGAARGVLNSAKSNKPVPLEQQKAQVKATVAASGDARPVLMVALPKQNAVATLIVAAENNGVRTWADATGVTIAARKGVVLSTRGLGFDVMASDVAGTQSAIKSGSGSYQRVQKFLDGEGQLMSHNASCNANGSAGVLTETCAGPNGSYENSYTYSGGKLVASRQWLGSEIGYAEVSRLQ